MKKKHIATLLFLSLFVESSASIHIAEAKETSSSQRTIQAETSENSTAFQSTIETNTRQTETTETTETTEQTTETTSDEQTDDSGAKDYYENQPSVRSDLDAPLASRSLIRSTIDTVYAGEGNRPKASFIDVSSHNGTISVEQYIMMKSYGVTGVVVKLTEGTTYTNPDAQSQVKNAQKAGMKVSVYHFSRYTNENEARAEADYFYSVARSLNLSSDTIMVSDIEASNMQTSAVNANTVAFKNRLNSFGYNQVVYYLSRSWLDVAGGVFQTSLFGQNNIWVAQYPYSPTASQNWNNNFSSWQWSSNFYFPGIAHPFDISTDYSGRFIADQWDETTPVTGTTVVTDIDNTENKMKITATIDAGKYKPTAVSFPVWSETNGQDDLVWYEGTPNADGTWSATVDISKHGYTGKYFVHTYVMMNANDNNKKMVNSTEFTISQPSFTATIDDSKASSGKFDVSIIPSSKSGVKVIRVPVWSKSDQSDLVWYDAVRQADGSYKVSVDISRHNYNQGNYTVNVYLTAGNNTGAAASLGKVNVTTGEIKGKTTVSDTSGNEMIYTPTLTLDMNGYGEPDKVYFATWSIKGGQDDLVWYEGQKQSNGTYTAAIDINKNHRTTGEYAISTYIRLANGTLKGIDSAKFTVSQPTFTGTIDDRNAKQGTFDVIITPESVSGVAKIQVPVWSQKDQSDLIWYEAVKQNNGTYKVSVDASKHKLNTGNYTVHTYLTAKNGTTYSKSLGTVAVELGQIKGKTTIVDEKKDETVMKVTTDLSMGGYGEPASLSYAVWSLDGGQDDLEWYVAKKLSNGQYEKEVDILTHKTAGEYAVHTYINLNGKLKGLSADSFTISTPKLEGTIENINKGAGTFDVVLTTQSPSGVDKIMVPVWSQSDQKDLIWYTAEKQGNNQYKVTVNKKNHASNAENYTVHAYLTAKNGVSAAKNIGKASFN